MGGAAVKVLTVEEIDVLEGDDLSYRVADAMGMNPRRYPISGGVEALLPGYCNIYRAWHPHDDEKQALQVWRAMPSGIHPILVSMDDAFACMLHGRFRAYGDFCGTICRAYLKVRRDYV
jgi:hypothetical protein